MYTSRRYCTAAHALLICICGVTNRTRIKLTNHACMLGLVVGLAPTLAVGVRSDETTDFKEQLRQLQEQNSQLQQQLLKQQQMIENLTHRLSDMEGANQK